jgi:isopropylmalate/homocitrate/citramalate synthase
MNDKVKWYPSPYNHHPEVEKLMTLPKKITVFDSTLREGEETPGVVMTLETKVRIAEKLVELGVVEAEIGYVGYIEDHAYVVKALRERKLPLMLGSLIRMWSPNFKMEIDKAVELGVDILELCGGASDHQLRIRNMSRGQLMDRMIEATEYARRSKKIIDFYPYDSVRTDLSYMKALLRYGVEAGADRVHVSDTLGNASPLATRFFIQEMKKAVSVPVQYHCHNDFGTAVANTCAAVEGGAEIIDLIINGLGDRAGNTNFQETVMTLTCVYGVDTGIKLEKLYETCKFVEEVTKFRMEENKPIVGKFCFVHESDIHVQALLSGYWSAFEPFLPEVVGQKRLNYFGSTTSREPILLKAKNMGYQLSSEQVENVLKRIKKEIDKKGYALEEEVGKFIKDLF